MRPYATSVCGLTLLVYAFVCLRDECGGAQAISLEVRPVSVTVPHVDVEQEGQTNNKEKTALG